MSTSFIINVNILIHEWYTQKLEVDWNYDIEGWTQATSVSQHVLTHSK